MIRGFLSILAAGFALTLAAGAKPLNIVLLYADDWRHDTLGCAGHPVVQTPRLDALAGEGVRFTRACVTTSICGVSRSTMLTGQWMSRHGNRGFDAFRTPWEETWPGILREAGWWSGHVGKWHSGKFQAGRFDFARNYGGKHFIKQEDGSEIHITRKNEADALDFLRSRPEDQPFFLTVNFFAAHAEDDHPDQYLPQPESAALYKDAHVPEVPDTFAKLPPAVSSAKNEGRRRWGLRFDTAEKYQTSMKNYFRLVTEVDTACGRVLDELQAQGLLEDTLVIFTTDNGYFHGEHGLADKWYPYEESIRVPLIVRDPRLAKDKRGATNDDIVLNADLAPTILAATGKAAPPTMQGRDFAPLYLSPVKPAWREDFYYEHAVIRDKDFIPASEALVTREWKYILWPDSGFEELFDLKNDPREQANLAATEKDRLEMMRKRFAESKDSVR
ncbi:sulfatase [Luteolibacter flavescens]|uniref:Sulfatase n=1 Tax=Luteolibacter flavescens TaxID=1859460 RepID=A0ABT3FKK8_9BACT|nr:sulfatase [Luteolibacter flavescens]MCW1884123.1 sulfatase [Luteolibacter flavescens]